MNKTLTSATAPASEGTAPLRIVLHESHSSTKERPEWVTHFENMQTGDKFSGRYYRRDGNPMAAYADAFIDYGQRCRELRVDPMPEQADEAPSKLLHERKELYRLAEQATRAGDVATVRAIRDALKFCGVNLRKTAGWAVSSKCDKEVNNQ